MSGLEENEMISFDVSTLAWLAGAWLFVSSLITLGTWKVASRRTRSPVAITISSALLAFFPPLNILLLALMSLSNRRCPP
jgi:hypothetical protein